MGKENELLLLIKEQDVQGIVKLLRKDQKAKTKLIGSGRRININSQERDGLSALHIAASIGNEEILKLLIDHGAILDVKDHRGRRPLHCAVEGGHVTSVGRLLEGGANANEPTYDGQAPLHISCRQGNYTVVCILLQYGADPTRIDHGHQTPLHLACQNGYHQIVQCLLNSGYCDSVIQDPRDPSMHLAARNGHMLVVGLLLEHGVDVNKQTLEGTCLHEAVNNQQLNVVKLLLQHDVDISLLNSCGISALDIANRLTNNRAVQGLRDLLTEACGNVYVAVHNHMEQGDLNFKAGDFIKVIHRSSDGTWKGHVVGQIGPPATFPADAVVPRFKTYSEDVRSPVFTFADHNRDSGISPGQTSLSSLPSVSQTFTGGDRTAQWVQHVSPSASTRTSIHRLSRDSFESHGSMSSLGSLEDAPTPPRSNNVVDLLQQGYKDRDVLQMWLTDLGFASYIPLFTKAGYDLGTISRMTPEDLTAIGIQKPTHRKRLKAEISRLNVHDGLPDQEPISLEAWLNYLGLSEYRDVLASQGYQDVSRLTDLSWEDLEDMAITRLGHQKKLLLASERLRKLRSNTYHPTRTSRENLDKYAHYDFSAVLRGQRSPSNDNLVISSPVTPPVMKYQPDIVPIQLNHPKLSLDAGRPAARVSPLPKPPSVRIRHDSFDGKKPPPPPPPKRTASIRLRSDSPEPEMPPLPPPLAMDQYRSNSQQATQQDSRAGNQPTQNNWGGNQPAQNNWAGNQPAQNNWAGNQPAQNWAGNQAATNNKAVSHPAANNWAGNQPTQNNWTGNQPTPNNWAGNQIDSNNWLGNHTGVNSRVNINNHVKDNNAGNPATQNTWVAAQQGKQETPPPNTTPSPGPQNSWACSKALPADQMQALSSLDNVLQQLQASGARPGRTDSPSSVCEDTLERTPSCTTLDTLPFANENVGTIKQKREENGATSQNNINLKGLPADKPVKPLVPPKNFQRPKPANATSSQSDDVFGDIGCMLENLTSELDAMLDT